MNIEWTGELVLFIFIFGLVSLAGFMIYDQHKQKKHREKKN